MAKADIKMPEEFLLKLSKLADKTDEIIPRVLQAGGEVVEAKVRANLQAVIGKDTKEDSRSTGELTSSLGTSPASVDHDGIHNVKVGFAEPRRQQNDAKGNFDMALDEVVWLMPLGHLLDLQTVQWPRQIKTRAVYRRGDTNRYIKPNRTMPVHALLNMYGHRL